MLLKLLDTPFQVSFTATSMTINSIAIDPENQLIHLGYAILDANDNPIQRDMPSTLSGIEYTNYHDRKNTLGATMSASDAAKQTALEYLPGVGTVVGDKKILNTPYVKDVLCSGLSLNSYAYNGPSRIVYIGYSYNESITTTIQENLTYTLSNQEYENFMTRLNENELSMSVTQAEVTTCLEFLPYAGTVQEV